MASSERRPEISAGKCDHEIGWVSGSREPVNPKEEEPQDASGDGFVGCIKCGEPVK
ncbi:MAG: hypothetical protein ACPLKP_03210 [Microgenomates group bacterium]